MGMPVAFWLLPGGPSMRVFANAVDALAGRYDAPRFTPHVTLHVEQVVPEADVEAALDAAAARFAPFAMQAGPTGHSAVLFKTLFVTLAGGNVVDLAAAVADAAVSWRPALAQGRQPAYRLDPHLSLLYKQLAENERARLAVEYRFEGESVYFDRITAVTPATGARDLSRVEDWVVARPRLLVGGDSSGRASGRAVP